MASIQHRLTTNNNFVQNEICLKQSSRHNTRAFPGAPALLLPSYTRAQDAGNCQLVPGRRTDGDIAWIHWQAASKLRVRGEDRDMARAEADGKTNTPFARGELPAASHLVEVINKIQLADVLKARVKNLNEDLHADDSPHTETATGESSGLASTRLKQEVVPPETTGNPVCKNSQVRPQLRLRTARYPSVPRICSRWRRLGAV